MSNVTQLLSAAEQGDARAASELLSLVYDELRKLAAHKLNQEKPGHTLQATALVHEAYLRLVGPGQQFANHRHFFAAAAEAMRRILIESARRKGSEKHGGQMKRLDLESSPLLAEPSADDLIAVSDAIDQLAKEDPVKAELVKLRCFVGLSQQEAAEALGLSRATAGRYWAYAKSWLYCQLYDTDTGDQN